jgi:hypothetical protein
MEQTDLEAVDARASGGGVDAGERPAEKRPVSLTAG